MKPSCPRCNTKNLETDREVQLMPLYEYLCDCIECQHVTEKSCRFTERYDAPECEKCGGPTHQIISRTTAVLKPGGVGWANTGYGGSAPAKPKNHDAKPRSKAADSSS